MLINYSNYYDIYPYHEEYTDIQLLLGCEYAPLADKYKNINHRIGTEVKKILVLTGGTDPYHFAREFARKIVHENDQKHSYIIVCGRYNEDLEEIRKIVSGQNNISVLFNCDYLEKLMKECDLAISAAGTTLYELAASGTPTLCYTFTGNQLKNAESFVKKNYMQTFGDLRNLKDMQMVFDQINWMENHYSERKLMSERLQKLVDGHGAERIVEKIEEIGGRKQK